MTRMSATRRAADSAVSTSDSTSLTVEMSVIPRIPATASAGTATAPSAINVLAARLCAIIFRPRCYGWFTRSVRGDRGGRLDHLLHVVRGVPAERQIEGEREL